jgi:hypothetical protein
MVRGAITRLLAATGATAVTVALAIGLGPAAALAAPPKVSLAAPPRVTLAAPPEGSLAAPLKVTLAAPPEGSLAAPPKVAKPTSIQIEGAGLSDTLIVRQAEQKRLFDTLLSEVNWMANAKPQTVAPKASKLGPKYTLTVMVKTVPTQVYDLYPMAAGGPRAHRSGNQPSGRKADGWFYGRLSMPVSLRASGVPLKPKPDVMVGGIGGGIGQDIDVQASDPATEVNGFIDNMRRLLLLNGAVLMVILVGLAGIAFLIRRKV